MLTTKDRYVEAAAEQVIAILPENQELAERVLRTALERIGAGPLNVTPIPFLISRHKLGALAAAVALTCSGRSG